MVCAGCSFRGAVFTKEQQVNKLQLAKQILELQRLQRALLDESIACLQSAINDPTPEAVNEARRKVDEYLLVSREYLEKVNQYPL